MILLFLPQWEIVLGGMDSDAKKGNKQNLTHAPPPSPSLPVLPLLFIIPSEGPFVTPPADLNSARVGAKGIVGGL